MNFWTRLRSWLRDLREDRVSSSTLERIRVESDARSHLDHLPFPVGDPIAHPPDRAPSAPKAYTEPAMEDKKKED